MSEKLVALAYGSNLGDRQENINKALRLLTEGSFSILKVSSPVESKPVDCTPGSGIFLNGAISGKWSGSAQQLLSLCQNIEKELGRKDVREINSPRPIDLDIILFGQDMIEEESLIVPHPRMNERDFVLIPLDEIASNWLVPQAGITVGELARKFK